MPTIDQVHAHIVKAYSVYHKDQPFQMPETKAFSGRMLEEMVETNLSLGMTAGEILGRVADALANEAKKKDCYPSELQRVYSHEDRDPKKEVIDLWVQLKNLTALVGLTEEQVDEGTQDKCIVLVQAAIEGKLYISDSGMFYRIKRQ